MANAYRDENSVPTLIAPSSANGTTIVRVKANAVTHALKVSNGMTGTNYDASTNALRDENNVPVLICVASRTVTSNGISYIQGVTPVKVYADSNGNLLTQST